MSFSFTPYVEGLANFCGAALRAKADLPHATPSYHLVDAKLHAHFDKIRHLADCREILQNILLEVE